MHLTPGLYKKAAAVAFFFPLIASAYYDLGKPAGFVNDFGGMLSADQKTALETKLIAYEKETGNEIAVVTISSLQEDTIENFAVKLFENWKIGKEEKDNGLLILIARDDRQMRIEVGYGLEGDVTDAQSFWILNKIMTPAFETGDYFAGINGAVDKIIAAAHGEKIPEDTQRRKPFTLDALFNFTFLFFVAVSYLGSMLARSKSWWAGGVIGGIGGIIFGIVNSSILITIIGGIFLAIAGLIFDYVVSSTYAKGVRTGGVHPWWIGGGRGGSSGGGFGGFGGGGSGGGGASGRW